MSVRKWLEDERYRKRWERHLVEVIMSSPEVPPAFKDENLIREFIEYLKPEVPRIASENPFTASKLLTISDDEYLREAKKNAFLVFLHTKGLVSRYKLTRSRNKSMTVKSLTSWLRVFKKTQNKEQKTNQYI